MQTAIAGPAGTRAAQAAFGAALLRAAPLTAAAGALYTVGSSLAEDFQGRRDWRSSAAGGALSGAVAVGLKQRSLQGGFVGALAFSAVCAAAAIAQGLEPSVQQVQGGGARSVVVTGEEYAASAAASRSFTSRLQ